MNSAESFEDETPPKVTGTKTSGIKPAFQRILLEVESRTKPEKTLAEVKTSRYHGYSRWIQRHADAWAVSLRLTEQPDHAEICEQGKFMCQEYIFNRLRKQNLLHHAGKTGPVIQVVSSPTDISSEIQRLGHELERGYPDLYTNLCKQLQMTIKSDTFIQKTFTAVAEHMVKNYNSITWGKVVALFALAAGFAQDCVQQGHPEFIATVLDTFESILSKYVAAWILKRGGWVDLVRTFRTSSETPVLWMLSIVGATVGFVVTLLATTQL